MSSRAVRIAALFLTASLAFAWWARRTARPPAAAPVDERASAAPEARPGASAQPARVPEPPRIQPPGGYSIDGRPNSIVGHVRIDALIGAARGVYPTVKLVHESGLEEPAPVAMSGFFGAGALADGEWKVRCTSKEHWTEERVVRLGPEQPRAELELELAPLPRLEITLRYPAGPLARSGAVLAREAWLEEARMVATRAPPSELVGPDVLDSAPVAQWFPRMRDEVAGGQRIQLLDGDLGLALEPGAWVSFVVAGRVVASRTVDKDATHVAFDLDQAQLSRALGALEVRVLDAELGTPLGAAVLAFPEGNREWKGRLDAQVGGVAFPGTLLLPRLGCGVRPVCVGAGGRELELLAVEIRPGETTRVEVQLEPERRVQGAVHDAQGQPVRIVVELAPFEDPQPALAGVSVRSPARADENGFAFDALPAAIWVLRARDPRLAFAPVVVDTREGDASGLSLEASPGTPLTLVRPARRAGNARGGTMSVRDTRGLVVLERRLSEVVDRIEARLLPGSYALTWEDAQGAPRERALVVESLPLVVELD